MISRLCAAIAAVMVLGGWGSPPPLPYNPYYVILPAPAYLLIGPGVGYAPLAQVPPNAQLPIVTCEYRSGWCLVRYGRFDGWVFDAARKSDGHHWYWPLGH